MRSGLSLSFVAGFIGTFPPWQSAQKDWAWQAPQVFTSWLAWNR
jgi:hypothetical protein